MSTKIAMGPVPIVETAHLPIPLPGGIMLSARVWRPADGAPVPVILEYLPYRKRDGTAERDALTHPYLASHGYACVRVDMRGCGDSEGLFDDEYSEQELTDGVNTIHWLAAQDWCDGTVGMTGISWGGFNGLQIAARAPSPLKAVVSICSSTDRFADDIHYKGGVMLGENPGWAATALSWFSMPPDPALVGRDAWRGIWLNRLENTPFLLDTWTRHQTRDAYWQHGSVCEDYAAIKAAVLSVGGWHDGYRNTISHLIEHLKSPVKGLIGPWNHKYPHIASPGPRIDFLGEMLRWYDHWLKGIDRGLDQMPDLRAYIMDSVAPEVSYTHRHGRWIGLDWPQTAPPVVLAFNENTLAPQHGPVCRELICDLNAGQQTGEYFPFGFGPGELPGDQTPDDARSLCFDGAVLDTALDLLGAPSVTLRLTADQTQGQLAVRLCDLRPDGTSALISHGFLNLRHRQGHAVSEPLVPGQQIQVDVLLDQCGYRLDQGHRLRVAISASYWPFIFPAGVATRYVVTGGNVSLPVLPMGAGLPVTFDPPVMAPPRKAKRLSDRVETKEVSRNSDSGILCQTIVGDDGLTEDLDTGLVTSACVRETFCIDPEDPASAAAEFAWSRTLGRGSWQVRSEAVVHMTGETDAFAINVSLRCFEAETQLFSRNWSSRIARV